MSDHCESDSYFRTLEVADVPLVRGQLKHVTVKSGALNRRGDLSVYMPEQVKCESSVPVVILLHGVYGSHWSWIYKANAHLTLQRLIDESEIPPMILVTPSDGLWGDGSGYLQHYESNFEDWVVKDVPQAVHEVTGNGLDCPWFIGGLSMGGYGALRLGASYPELFYGFAGHSSITQFDELAQFIEEPLESYPVSQEHRSSVISAILKNRKQLKPFRFDCGVEDPLLVGNRGLRDSLLKEGVKFVYEEFSGGHEWSYWEEHVEKTFRFFGELVHQ